MFSQYQRWESTERYSSLLLTYLSPLSPFSIFFFYFIYLFIFWLLKLTIGDKIVSAQFNKAYDVVEVGILHPENQPTDALYEANKNKEREGEKCKTNFLH